MQAEKWIKWKPAEDLAKTHFVKIIIDKIFTLDINFFESYGEERKHFILTFDNTVIGYRSVDEGIRLMISDNCIQDDGKDLYGQWTFFKARNSSYLRWLSEQSDFAVDLHKLTHFVIITESFIVDIAALNEPIIKYI